MVVDCDIINDITWEENDHIIIYEDIKIEGTENFPVVLTIQNGCTIKVYKDKHIEVGDYGRICTETTSTTFNKDDIRTSITSWNFGLLTPFVYKNYLPFRPNQDFVNSFNYDKTGIVKIVDMVFYESIKRACRARRDSYLIRWHYLN